jgi:PAS domain S-box-containing protein
MERGRRLRALCLEDDPQDAELAILALRDAGYSVDYEVVAERDDFLQRAQSGKFDLVLADYGLPGWTGMDAVRQLRTLGCEIPVILVTGSLGDETAVECVKQGVSDYVLKHRLVRLPIAVARVLRTRELQAEQAASERERERLLRDLGERERKYRELFELANDAILIFEPKQETILEANASACELYGFSHAQLVGKSLKELTLDVARGERQIAELTRAGRWTNFDTVHRRSDGAEIHILANSKMIEYAGRSAVLTVNHDVTELRRAQDALRRAYDELEKRVEERTAELAKVNVELRRARDKWQNTFDCMSDAITVHDTSFNILRWNRAFREMFPQADIGGQKCYQIVHGTEAPPPHCPMARSLLSGQPGTSEFFEPHLQRWVCARADLLRDPEGRIERIVHSISDISERKEIERMKNDFISCVSHELRTPLSSLRGFAELMLQREYPPEKQRHFLEIIDRESRRLGDLVNDVLDLQRIESGRALLQFDPVMLPELVQETAELFSAPGERHRIVNEVPPESPPVLADAEAVRQILRNLVSNALKYSPGGGEIRIGGREDAGQVLVWVSDQGMGIPPELLPHVFSKFYRAPESVARKIGGTGLGLAVVKGLVEAHHGAVWVESTPGKGSIFYFTLPFAHARAAEAA